MPDQTSVDKVLSIVLGLAQEGVASLTQAGAIPRPDAALEAGKDWTVFVAVFPTPLADRDPALSECERDVLALLAQASAPLSAVRVRRELERSRIGVYSLSTVKRSLARLRKRTLILNSRRGSRGYSLTDKRPLFLRRNGCVKK